MNTKIQQLDIVASPLHLTRHQSGTVSEPTIESVAVQYYQLIESLRSVALWTAKCVTLAWFTGHHHSLRLEKETVVRHAAAECLQETTLPPFLLVLSGEAWCWGREWAKKGPEKKYVRGGERDRSIQNHSETHYFSERVLIKSGTMFGLLTTVVLFLRLRRTSLWNTWELSLEGQIHTAAMSLLHEGPLQL